MMKYITSSFSKLMFQNPQWIELSEELSRDQFLKEIKGAHSCVSAENIAEDLGVPRNKETVKARPGDIIYNVAWDHGEFKYFKVQVMPSTLLDGNYCEELI